MRWRKELSSLRFPHIKLSWLYRVMTRKIYVNVTVRLIIRADEDQNIDEVLENMDYNFTASESDNADIEDTEITDWELVDVS